MGSRVWASRTHLRWLAWPCENSLLNMWGRKRNTSLPFRLTKKSISDDLKLPLCEQVQKILERLSQLEPELGDAVKKILLYDKVLKNLKADVEKFRDMVQDICFHQIILSQGFETIFNRSDNNEDIQEHHQRSVKLANTVRGKFETSLRKKVLDLISKHLEKNKAQLQEALSWYKDVNSKLLDEKNNLSEVDQRLIQVEMNTAARKITTALKSRHEKRFASLRTIFTNFQYIQKHWFVASGRALIDESTLDSSKGNDGVSASSSVENLICPLRVLSFIPAEELCRSVSLVSNKWRYRVFQTLSSFRYIASEGLKNFVCPSRIILSLSYSKALHLYIRNSWLPMLESTVKNSSVEKLLEIVYPPGSPQRLVQTHDIIAQIKAAYRKLTENLRKNISGSVEESLLSLFSTIDRDVDRTYGKVGKEIVVHADEDEASFWQHQSFSESGTSALDVENMVGAALGDISMGISASDHSADESMNHDERIKVRRASEDDGLMEEDDKILVAKERIKNVLRAFVLANKRVSYVQGMNFIARSILKNCNNDESEAFAQLLALYEFYGYDEMASNDLGRLKICLFQLENLIRLHLPNLHQHFAAENVNTIMYASGWFMTIFTRNDVLSPSLSLEVVKKFFLFGWPILFKVSLAVLAALERMLLSRDFEGMVKFLQHSRGKVTKEFPSSDELFAKADEFKVTTKQLLRFEELYKQRRN